MKLNFKKGKFKKATFFQMLANLCNVTAKIKWLLISIYIGLLCVVFYHFFYAQKIIPGVKVGSVNVGGLTYSQAKTALNNAEKNLTKDLAFKYNENEYHVKGEDVGFVYDWDAAVTRAFEVGRTKNVYIDTKDKLVGLVKPLYIGAFYDYDNVALQNVLLTIQGEVDEQALNSVIALDKNNFVITPSKEGRKVVAESLSKMVYNAFDRMDFTPRELPVKNVHPRIAEDDLKKVFDQVTALASKKFKVYTGDYAWNLTKTEALDFIELLKNNNNELEISLNDSKFEAFIETLRQDVNVLPRGQVTQTDNNKVVNFEITQEGKEVDDKKFMDDFKNAFFGDQNSVEIPMKVISKFADKDKYGIFALLGEGKSKFTGSGSARVHNLTLAAARTNGVLVPPGSIYSMNKSIGEISLATGYDTALIIKEGRTVLGEGGGVCQTSTTLFRAALNAGLPIVMRYPHDYRVYYYEIDSPVGFDASIFQPAMDLRFKNDTPNYVLVQSSWNLTDMSLTFKIFGTPDGRTVDISEPVVSGVTPPPETLYQDDPTMLVGTTKQIDYSAWGANVFFTRTVKKGDQILSEDTFSSHYRPWRAIFLVGTKKPAVTKVI